MHLHLLDQFVTFLSNDQLILFLVSFEYAGWFKFLFDLSWKIDVIVFIEAIVHSLNKVLVELL
jgi:hypothetical protein